MLYIVPESNHHIGGALMKRILPVLVICMYIIQTAAAQPLDNVQLSGIVRGYWGPDTTVLSGSTVVIENFGTGIRDSVITNSAGLWSWIGTSSSAGEHHPAVPGNIALAPSYPNPFSETTTIRIYNNSVQRVRLDVYNVLGQRAAELVDDNLRPGAFELSWDGMNRNGTLLAPGMYFLCLQAGGHVVTQKIVVLAAGSGRADRSLRVLPQGIDGEFEPPLGSQLRGHAHSLDEFSLRLEFRDAGYDSAVTSVTFADGQDSSFATVLRRHVPPAGLALVQAGPYTMGSTVVAGFSIPEHSVNVPAFYIDTCEVTNEQYRAFCVATDRTYPSDPGWTGMPNYFVNTAYNNYPVVNVSWQDAKDFCLWRGTDYRLPTEAEWERAAKGNADNRLWPWGDIWVSANANISGVGDGYGYTSPVGSYLNGISLAGCYDMAGNVWEWCEDDWHPGYMDAPSDGSAWIDTPRGSNRVLRGSSWYTDGTLARCAARGSVDATFRFGNVGFRCARAF
jgi:formylglycine-generating enzyme